MVFYPNEYLKIVYSFNSVLKWSSQLCDSMQKKRYYCVFWTEKFLKVNINTCSIVLVWHSDACNFKNVCWSF